METCQTKGQLLVAVNESLRKMIELLEQELRELSDCPATAVAEMDVTLERWMGEKERRMGAYWEHRRAHGC